LRDFLGEGNPLFRFRPQIWQKRSLTFTVLDLLRPGTAIRWGRILRVWIAYRRKFIRTERSQKLLARTVACLPISETSLRHGFCYNCGNWQGAM